MTEQIKRKRGRPLGHRLSDETRRKMSDSIKEVWKDDSMRKMYAETQKAGKEAAKAAKAIHQEY